MIFEGIKRVYNTIANTVRSFRTNYSEAYDAAEKNPQSRAYGAFVVSFVATQAALAITPLAGPGVIIGYLRSLTVATTAFGVSQVFPQSTWATMVASTKLLVNTAINVTEASWELVKQGYGLATSHQQNDSSVLAVQPCTDALGDAKPSHLSVAATSVATLAAATAAATVRPQA